MEDSHLARIPGELRNEIYELVLHEPYVFEYRQGKFRRSHQDRFNKLRYVEGREGTPLVLTQTCKQIREESLPLFYKINAFRICARFWCFGGEKFSRNQQKAYGEILGGCRTSLKQFATASSMAISRFEIDLGEQPGPFPYNGTWDREWWTFARKMERDLLGIGTLLSPSAIHVTVWSSYELFSYHSYNTPSRARDFYGASCWANPGSRRFLTQWTIPVGDNDKAVKEIKRTYADKMEEFEGHIDHQVCLPGEWLPHMRLYMKFYRDLLLNAVGKKYLAETHKDEAKPEIKEEQAENDKFGRETKEKKNRSKTRKKKRSRKGEGTATSALASLTIEG